MNIREFVGAFLMFTFITTAILDLVLWQTWGYEATISWVINQYIASSNTHPGLIWTLGFAFGILANHFFFKWGPGPNKENTNE